MMMPSENRTHNGGDLLGHFGAGDLGDFGAHFPGDVLGDLPGNVATPLTLNLTTVFNWLIVALLPEIRRKHQNKKVIIIFRA